jgi:formylglycine-generating enzyme
MKQAIQSVCAGVVVAALVSVASGVDIETVAVGNVGNSADSTGYGAVDYEYNIGKYEVSNAEYSEFLNAVATVGDPHRLYNNDMGSGWYDIGGISRAGSGTSGNPWVYSTRTNRANRPVNFVNWGNAARFANWLHNGQPSGAEDLNTTEDGAYYLDGAMSNAELLSVDREADWKWAVTSEDEWYKAAYYDSGSGVYYNYPTGSDTPPRFEAPAGTDMTDGSANYSAAAYVDTTYYTTERGAYDAKPSDSPYGTFDQGGNVWEWNEAIGTSYRGLRGGSFDGGNSDLHATRRYIYGPPYTPHLIGFRVAQVPEPATISFLALGGLVLIRRRKCGCSNNRKGERVGL